MSASSGWVCTSCRRHLRSALLRANRTQAPRRSFVSLQDINRKKHDDENEEGFKASDKQAEEEGIILRESTQSESTSDAFLEKLFKSTGRDPPASPLLLRYSQRLLHLNENPNKAIDGQSRMASDHKSRVRGRNPPATTTAKGQAGLTSPPEASEKDPSDISEPHASTKLVDDARAFRDDVAMEPPSTASGETTETQEPPLNSRNSHANGLSESDEPSIGKGKAESGRQWQVQKVSKAPAHIVVARIRGATDARKPWLVKGLWRQFRSEAMENRYYTSNELSNSFSDIMSLFVENRYYNWASEVWAAIHEQELTPTQKQWSIMLELAKSTSDNKSLNIIWDSMQAAEIVPDNYAWTTYISATGRKNPYAINILLNNLMNQWDWISRKSRKAVRALERSDISRYAPNIAPFNAALACIVYKRRDHFLREILHRMESLKLSPNIETFNTLLKRAVALGQNESEVDAVLNEMKRFNIEPDKITFTTLLNGRLHELGADADPEAIESRVKELFAEFDSEGARLAPHSYTTALSVALNNGDRPNVAAAKAIMKHMRDNGIAYTPHTYAIMASYYFRSEPPNRAAVEELFARAKAHEIEVDHYFYDRLIEGFAALKDTDRMLECIRHVERTGKAPGWIALTEALHLLSEMQYWTICDQVVSDVENQQGIGAQGIRSQVSGQARFWELVDELRSHGFIPESSTGTINGSPYDFEDQHMS